MPVPSFLDVRHLPDFRPVEDLEDVDWDNYPAAVGDETERVRTQRHSLTAHYFRDVGAAWDDDKWRLR